MFSDTERDSMKRAPRRTRSRLAGLLFERPAALRALAHVPVIPREHLEALAWLG
jgi:hypothetical protein